MLCVALSALEVSRRCAI